MKFHNAHGDRCCCPFKKRRQSGHVGKKLKRVSSLHSKYLNLSANDRICKDCRDLFDKTFSIANPSEIGK